MRAVAVAALAATLLPAPASAIELDPRPYRDGVAFGQRDLRMVLKVRGARSACLVLRDRGRLCAARFLSWRPAGGDARGVPGRVVRRGRSLRAVFAPRALGLRLGPLRWAVETARDRSPDRGWRRTAVRLVGQPYCFGAAARDRRRPCRNPALRRVVFPRPVDAFTWDSAPCRRLPGSGLFAPCEFGPARAPVRFAVIGDSHAMHWRRALEVVAEARRWRGISIARPGCPFSVAIPRSPALGPGQCARVHRRTIAFLGARPEIETLFVSNWAQPGYSGGAAEHGTMLDRVPASVKRIHVLRDIPATTVRALDCVRARRRRCANRRSSVLFDDPGAAAAASRPRVRVIDLTRFFCGPSRCHPVVGGAYVYKDFDHMNAVFALSLGPYVLRALRTGA